MSNNMESAGLYQVSVPEVCLSLMSDSKRGEECHIFLIEIRKEIRNKERYEIFCTLSCIPYDCATDEEIQSRSAKRKEWKKILNFLYLRSSSM